MRKTWDFFISYASEDRTAAANPIEAELTKRGFAVWLDHKVLSEARKLVEEIHTGLSNCHYGIIILSPRFLSKDWPMRELDTLFAIESIEWAATDRASAPQYDTSGTGETRPFTAYENADPDGH